jgi:hypothetical protein
VATQERFDLARLRTEKLCQDLCVVPLTGQAWFQSVNILGEYTFDHIHAHRFLADLVSFFECTRQMTDALRAAGDFASSSLFLMVDAAKRDNDISKNYSS